MPQTLGNKLCPRAFSLIRIHLMSELEYLWSKPIVLVNSANQVEKATFREFTD